MEILHFVGFFHKRNRNGLPLRGGGRGGRDSTFRRSLYLFELWQYVEYELHCMGYFTWHSVRILVSLGHACVECTNFRRGLYLKFCYVVNTNSVLRLFYLVFNRILCFTYKSRMWYITDANDCHTGCNSLSAYF